MRCGADASPACGQGWNAAHRCCLPAGTDTPCPAWRRQFNAVGSVSSLVGSTTAVTSMGSRVSEAFWFSTFR